ncbi:MAG: type 1 glutamine amidotransferase [Aigarchaeota archaeon]|nr:type 1 glutamine amidotransferase [Aigarchaeota archaeon]
MNRLKGVRIAVVAGPEFEDIELLYPYYRLLEEGAEVKVIAQEKRAYSGKHGISVNADLTFVEADPASFDALFIPGGWMPDRVRRDRAAVEWIRRFAELGRPIGVICHGGQLLISAKAVRGYRMTAVSAIRDDLENAGAEFVDAPVVRDRNVVSSRVPADLPHLMPEFIALVEESAKRVRVAERGLK